MDELERALREVLTDDRLELPVPPGAARAVHAGVRRRRQRRRAIAAASAVAVVALGTGGVVAFAGGGNDRDVVVPGGKEPPTHGATSPPTSGPSPTTCCTPSPTGNAPAPTIDWNPLPYTGPVPFHLAGSVPDPSVPWCTSGQLTATATEFQGAAGSLAGGVRIVNSGQQPCALQGPPAITGYDAHDHVVATPATQDAFVAHPWWVLRPGGHAQTLADVTGIGSRCQSAVTRLSVDLGHGGTSSLSVPATRVGGGGVNPPCGDVPAAQQATHYAVSAGDWTRPDGKPSFDGSNDGIDIGTTPATVMQGTMLRYQLTWSGPVPRPCLPFREQLISTDSAHTVLAQEDHLLSCQAMSAQSGASSYVLDLQLAVPTGTPPGSAYLQWETPLPGQMVTSGTIHITPAPPQCQQQQLTVGPGRPGVAAGSYYDTILFTNVSGSACSLRGYPGVQFVDPGGRPLPTHPQRDTLHDVETVALAAHGGVASFLVSGADFAPPAGASPCPQTGGLLVIAPNLTTQVLVHAGADCEHGRIRVYPVVAGRHPAA